MSNRILFACYHCYLDPSNGASITAREILYALSKLGWNVQVFSGPGLDYSDDVSQILSEQVASTISTSTDSIGTKFTLRNFSDKGVVSTLFIPKDTNKTPSKETGETFLQLLYQTIKNTEPDIMLTYGSYWLGPLMLKLTRGLHIKNVVLLQNLAYNHANYFRDVDCAIVPSVFARKYYAEKIGLKSTPIPPLLNENTSAWSPDPAKRKYLTFVNPEYGKGLLWFVRMVKVLNDRHPDIPLLAVESRGKIDNIAGISSLIKEVKNIYVMHNTPNPRDFMEVSKVVMMPSYHEETFGRVAAEAMMNGIPVIGSNRGALPEVIGKAGILLDIPSRYRPDSREVPTEEEVNHWINAVTDLWYNEESYDRVCRRCRQSAERWRWDTVARQYDACFTEIIR